MALTVEELRARGFGRYIIDRNTHPDFHVSNWPVSGSGYKLLGDRQNYRLPHINYQSILVTVISNRWLEGGWHRLQDMIHYTEQQGYTVALEEVDDPSTMPQDAIGMMRACAAMLALDSGFQWCLMLDTDALLEKDTLVRLLAHDRPIVFPFIVDLEDRLPDAPLLYPRLKVNTGLQPTLWASMSCMLYDVKVFNCLTPYAWHGHDYHFAQCLGHHGHRIYVDTDNIIHTSRGSGRLPMKTWEELWEHLETNYKRAHNEDRDRRPPPDFDPVFGTGEVDEFGVYWGAKNWRHLGVNGPNQPPVSVDGPSANENS